VKRKEIIKLVAKEAEKHVEEYGLELFDVDIETKGGSTVISVKLTSDSGVNLDDCHKVHVHLSKYLDDVDPIEDSYFLEVSSPGLDASLKSEMAMSKSIGKEVYVKTYVASDKWPKSLVGILKSYDEKEVEIENEEQIYRIERKMISTIKLHFSF
jgi:ribosome maturation factor RimP